MSWKLRHEGSPQAVEGLTLQQIAEGLRDGELEPTDEVRGPTDAGWTTIESHPSLADVVEDLEAPLQIHHDEGTHLDFNALIDVCLVLLIFFILTTTYASSVRKVVPLPTVKDEGKKTRVVSVEDVKKRMIRLQANVDGAGKPVLRLENQPIQVLADDQLTIDRDKLRQALKPYVTGENRKTEIILDARGITWGTVIEIQDGAKAAGIHMIHHLLKK